MRVVGRIRAARRRLMRCVCVGCVSGVSCVRASACRGKAIGLLGASPAVAAALFRAADAGRDGALSLTAVVAWALTLRAGRAEEKLAHGFRMLDADGDGRVSEARAFAVLSETTAAGACGGGHEPSESGRGAP